jgi:parallel beta-helix repeat protein
MKGVHDNAIFVIGAIVLITSLILLSGGGEGATITVDDDGGADFETIQDAIEAAADGDRIEVGEGTYYENVVLDKIISLVGERRNGTIINGSGSGSVISITSDLCLVTGFTIENSGNQFEGAGIEIKSDHIGISNCTLKNNLGDGINIRDSAEVTISDVLCSDNLNNGIDIRDSDNCEISYSFCSTNSQKGISCVVSDHVTISNTVCSGQQLGAYIYESDSLSISNSSFFDNIGHGIESGKSNFCHITDTICANNSYGGIRWANSNNAVFTSVSSLKNDGIGIELTNSRSCVIFGSNVSNNEEKGLFLSQSDNAVISSSSFSGNLYGGIYLSYTESCTLFSNTMVGDGFGFWGSKLEEWNSHTIPENNTVNGSAIRYLKNMNNFEISSGDGPIILANCSDISLSDLSLKDDKAIIEIGYSSHISITNAEFTSGNTLRIMYSDTISISNSVISRNREYGLYARHSNNFLLRKNTFSGNGYGGVSIMDSSHFTLHSNSFIENGFHISGSYENLNSLDIPVNNTMNGKPIRFLRGARNVPLPPGDGPIILVNCTDIIIQDQTLNDIYTGIIIKYSSRIRISNTTVTNNTKGISIDESNNVTMVNISCFNNFYSGIGISESEFCSIEDSYSSDNGYSGIVFSSVLNFHITNVRCENNSWEGAGQSGIYLSYCEYGTITDVVCTGNFYNGLHIYRSSSIDISQSTFMSNQIGIFFYKEANGNMITNNSIGNNEQEGILLFSTTHENSILWNSIFNNGKDGIKLYSSSSDAQIHFNDIINNSYYGINVTDGGTIIDASQNYWGDPTGPFHPIENSAGKGDSVSDFTPFDPWLTSPVHPPVAVIESISPSPVVVTESVVLLGHGDSLTDITTYTWSSSIDGELYNGSDPTFTTSTLSLGTHTISLKVRDSYGEWSEEVTATLIVHERPTVTIQYITPNPVDPGVIVTFGSTPQDDGYVLIYKWTSSIDGVLFDGPGSGFSLSNLSLGNHTITLMVQDNHGAWSEEVTATLVVGEEIIPNTNVLPLVTVRKPANNSVVSGIISVGGSAEDRDGWIEDVEISVNNGAWIRANGTSLWSYSFDSSELPDGLYIIRIRSFDGTDHSNITSISITVKNEEENGGGDGGGEGFIPGFGAIHVLLVLGGITLLTQSPQRRENLFSLRMTRRVVKPQRAREMMPHPPAHQTTTRKRSAGLRRL